MNEAIRGRDMGAPIESISFRGERVPLKFNNRAARIAEDVYASEYGRDVGYYDIIAEVAVPKHRAIMAVIYGAMVAAGSAVTWAEFDEHFHLTDVPGVSEAILRGTMASLPTDEADGDGKNPQATPTESLETATRGRG